MDVKFVVSEKNEVEVEIPSLTISEILRVYLNQESGVDFVAWKREHMTKNPVLKVQSKDKDVKSLIKSAIDALTKDLDGVQADFKAIK
jgi:DNA-directed RNA polymerase subunit L